MTSGHESRAIPLARHRWWSVVAGTALVATAGCGGSDSPGPAGDPTSDPTEQPAVPVAIPETDGPGGDGHETSAPPPSPSPGADTGAVVWELPAEADGWALEASADPGVFRFEHPDGCYATYSETPLDRNPYTSPTNSVDTAISQVEEVFGNTSSLPTGTLAFRDGSDITPFETGGVVYPSELGEDYALVVSAYWTDNYELTAGLACPAEDWQDDFEGDAVAFLEQATFDGDTA